MIVKQLIVAQSIIVDFQSKRITAINLYEDIISQVFPVAIPVSICTFISKNENEPDEASLSLNIKINEQILIRPALNVNFGNQTTVKNILGVNALIIPHAGILSFEVIHNDSVIGSFKISIMASVAQVTESEIPTVPIQSVS